jgi:hypothetical protein
MDVAFSLGVDAVLLFFFFLRGNADTVFVYILFCCSSINHIYILPMLSSKLQLDHPIS